jgi:hypothetical protein
MSDPQPRATPATSSPSALRALLRDEWPYLVVLALALLGIAVGTVLRKPMTIYWVIGAPLVGAICVYTQWRSLPNGNERLRMARAQALHWVAVVVAMHLMFVTDVARMMQPEASALAALVLLSLGTFTAGVQLAAWRFCLIGAIMAVSVPGIAWLGRTALLWLLAALLIVAVASPIAWNLRRWRKTDSAPRPIH